LPPDPSTLWQADVDTAARLTEELLPRVPGRQFVLSLPFEIRCRVAWDGELVSAVLAVFLRVVYGWYRRQARARGHADSRCGSVTFVQRFGSSLDLNPHVTCSCSAVSTCRAATTVARCSCRRRP
jgi:hypothetical protein